MEKVPKLWKGGGARDCCDVKALKACNFKMQLIDLTRVTDDTSYYIFVCIG